MSGELRSDPTSSKLIRFSQIGSRAGDAHLHSKNIVPSDLRQGMAAVSKTVTSCRVARCRGVGTASGTLVRQTARPIGEHVLAGWVGHLASSEPSSLVTVRAGTSILLATSIFTTLLPVQYCRLQRTATSGGQQASQLATQPQVGRPQDARRGTHSSRGNGRRATVAAEQPGRHLRVALRPADHATAHKKRRTISTSRSQMSRRFSNVSLRPTS